MNMYDHNLKDPYCTLASDAPRDGRGGGPAPDPPNNQHHII